MKRQAGHSFDWGRFRRYLWLVVIFVPLLPFIANILGVAGQMILAIMDGAMGSNLTPHSPAITWAIVGAFGGITPALWTLPTFRKRRALVLLVPCSALLLLGGLGLCLSHADATLPTATGRLAQPANHR